MSDWTKVQLTERENELRNGSKLTLVALYFLLFTRCLNEQRLWTLEALDDTTSIRQASIGKVSIGQASVSQVRRLVKYVNSSSREGMGRFVK